MINLFDNEINPFFGTETEKIRKNFTNNIRWLYIDLLTVARCVMSKTLPFYATFPNPPWNHGSGETSFQNLRGAK